ncbi:hypothetical protein [Microbacterium sp. PMB16]|uniref:hypothetical protein n=1 Tax=Microbacterium sp. PMB16 TaxID=3120157 RepID=UPI003F4BE7F3
MTTSTASFDELLAPILADWTIRDLLEWLSDDTRTHDDALRRPLALIESALTGSLWTREPSTVALIRSIASTVQSSPHVRNMRLDDLLPGAAWIRSAPRGGDSAAFSIHAAEDSWERVPQVV